MHDIIAAFSGLGCGGRREGGEGGGCGRECIDQTFLPSIHRLTIPYLSSLLQSDDGRQIYWSAFNAAKFEDDRNPLEV